MQQNEGKLELNQCSNKDVDTQNGWMKGNFGLTLSHILQCTNLLIVMHVNSIHGSNPAFYLCFNYRDGFT